ncbi:DUF6361 family protein [Fodinicurvata halophila]|uniref:DUF6361 family protein n=1 Tax=Fodinicurvata halophila TaxID=1419723 RepID=A0ABV8ULZ9_9PROT
MSSLTWVDFDAEEQKRVQHILAMFEESTTRNELGLAAIRDSISDHFFPGTSTIHTRLRYMLFIPWMLQEIEEREASERVNLTTLRKYEGLLIDALEAGGETNGVIGQRSRSQLQRLPTHIYWYGLESWGIRIFHGSLDSYLAALRQLKQTGGAISQINPEDTEPRSFLIESLPKAPEGFLDKVDFTLRTEEAEFLRDRLSKSHRNTLLTQLSVRDYADCNYVWEHPCLSELEEITRDLLEHARLFSHLMHGAALLYGLQICELLERDDWLEKHSEALHQWTTELELGALRHWSLDKLRGSDFHDFHAIKPKVRNFVAEWKTRVVETQGNLANDPKARELIKKRERGLKGSKSRFTNSSVRRMWNGETTSGRMDFRWPQANSYLRDLANAQ